MSIFRRLYGFLAQSHRVSDGSIIRPCTRESLELIDGARRLEIDFLRDPDNLNTYRAYLDKKHSWKLQSEAGLSSYPTTQEDLQKIERLLREYAHKRGIKLEVVSSGA